MTDNSLFFKVKLDGGLICLINKRDISSATNSSITWTNIQMKTGHEFTADCDFDDLQSQLLKMKDNGED